MPFRPCCSCNSSCDCHTSLAKAVDAQTPDDHGQSSTSVWKLTNIIRTLDYAPGPEPRTPQVLAHPHVLEVGLRAVDAACTRPPVDLASPLQPRRRSVQLGVVVYGVLGLPATGKGQV